MNTNGQVFGGAGGGAGGGSAMDNEYASLKNYYQQDYVRRVGELLAGIPGVRVQANVELTKEIMNHLVEVKVDPKGVAIHDQSSERTLSTTKESTKGDVGVRGQSSNSPRAVASSGIGSKTEDGTIDTKTDLVVGHKEVRTKTVGLTPDRVSIAIAIPASYYERVWKQQNVPTEGEEPKAPDENAIKSLKAQVIKDIEKQVNSLLPPVEGGVDPFPRVTVATFQDFPAESMPELGMSDHAIAWFGENWSALGMTGVAMFSLLMLRSMVRSSPTAPSPDSAELDADATPDLAIANFDDQPTDGEVTSSLRSKRRRLGGPNLRDELSDIVKEDPDAAANILKSWIANAG